MGMLEAFSHIGFAGTWDGKSQSFWFKTSNRNVLIVNGMVERYRAAGLRVVREIEEIRFRHPESPFSTKTVPRIVSIRMQLFTYPYNDTKAPTKKVWELCVNVVGGRFEVSSRLSRSGRVVITINKAHLVDYSTTEDLGWMLRDQKVVYFGRKQNTHRVIGYTPPFTGVN